MNFTPNIFNRPIARILYISYDGMTDQLGQSQVIPYLLQLSEKGNKIFLLSFEKKNAFIKSEKEIRNLLNEKRIEWFPQLYTKNPPIISTYLDIRKMRRMAKKIHLQQKIEIVHCRSYIAAFAGLFLKKKFGVKFLFDIRGFWPEERIDGQIWSLKNPVYKQIFKYFKKKEKEFFLHSDAVVSLTNASKSILKDGFSNQLIEKPIEVIPCCADICHFNYNNCSSNTSDNLKKKLNIPENSMVVLYLGSLGTWYMLDEMLDFFTTLKHSNENSLFLFVTKDNPEIIYKKADSKNISKESLRIISAERSELPDLIYLASFSLFFIKPLFSKKASSPTKLA
ncbi:MAG: glycosyltransferase, partial [Bacteroidales bacterium]|nr:glycosyltransferase [Bacteroidales bacterium]